MEWADTPDRKSSDGAVPVPETANPVSVKANKYSTSLFRAEIQESTNPGFQCTCSEAIFQKELYTPNIETCVETELSVSLWCEETTLDE